MIVIVRTSGDQAPPFDIKMSRRTPPIIANSAGKSDFFCLTDPEAARLASWTVVPVHDGWYADDSGGGMAIWGQGLFWEVRETPFKVREACGPVSLPAPNDTEDDVANVRAAIFRG